MTTTTRTFTEEDTQRLAVVAEEITEYKKFVTERFVRFLDLFYGIKILDDTDWDNADPALKSPQDWIKEYTLLEHTLYGGQHSNIIFSWQSKRTRRYSNGVVPVPSETFAMPTVFLYQKPEEEADYIDFLRMKKQLFG